MAWTWSPLGTKSEVKKKGPGLCARPDRAFELAVKDEGAGPDLGLDLGPLGDGQRPGRDNDLAHDAALDEHVLVGFDVPGDDGGRTQPRDARAQRPLGII